MAQKPERTDAFYTAPFVISYIEEITISILWWKSQLKILMTPPLQIAI